MKKEKEKILYTKLEIQHSIKFARKEIEEWRKFIKMCEKYLKEKNK